MPWWGWLLIGVPVGIVVGGAAFVVYMAKLFEEGDNPRVRRKRK